MRDEDRVRILHMIDAADAGAQFVAGRSRADLEQDRMLAQPADPRLLRHQHDDCLEDGDGGSPRAGPSATSTGRYYHLRLMSGGSRSFPATGVRRLPRRPRRDRILAGPPRPAQRPPALPVGGGGWVIERLSP